MTSNPELGSITDGLIEDIDDDPPPGAMGAFSRLSAGSWSTWREGMRCAGWPRSADLWVIRIRAASQPRGRWIGTTFRSVQQGDAVVGPDGGVYRAPSSSLNSRATPGGKIPIFSPVMLTAATLSAPIVRGAENKSVSTNSLYALVD